MNRDYYEKLDKVIDDLKTEDYLVDDSSLYVLKDFVEKYAKRHTTYYPYTPLNPKQREFLEGVVRFPAWNITQDISKLEEILDRGEYHDNEKSLLNKIRKVYIEFLKENNLKVKK